MEELHLTKEIPLSRVGLEPYLSISIVIPKEIVKKFKLEYQERIWITEDGENIILKPMSIKELNEKYTKKQMEDIKNGK